MGFSCGVTARFGFGRATITKSCFVFSPIKPVASLRRGLLRGSALAALCAAAAPAAAQTYVGNDFSPGSSLLDFLQAEGNSDKYSPFVILQEYSPSGPSTAGAIFGSAGTVNDVSFYGGGNYDFTVYALALDRSNLAKNEQAFTVVGDETFNGDATTRGVQNLAASFSVGAGDYLAFAGIGPWYPQTPNNAVGSDATYESPSEPQTYPTSFTAIAPTAGQTFTVGAHGNSSATYEIVPNPFENQGRSYGIGVSYTSSAAPTAYYLRSGSLAIGTELEQRRRTKQLDRSERRDCLAACAKQGRLHHEQDGRERKRADHCQF